MESTTTSASISGSTSGKDNNLSAAGPSSSCQPPAPTNNNNNKEELLTVAPANFFRPIKFESTPTTPESNGYEENGSTGGSESTIDSAYGSEATQARAGNQNSEGQAAQGGEASEEAVEPPYSGSIVVNLQNKNLWKSFRKIGNEMIVTKPGRLVLHEAASSPQYTAMPLFQHMFPLF